MTETHSLGDWRELLMDDFCVMFSRAERDIEPIDWVERMEEFVENLLLAQKEGFRREIEGTKVLKEHICRFNDGEQTCDCYNEALNDLLTKLDTNGI